MFCTDSIKRPVGLAAIGSGLGCVTAMIFPAVTPVGGIIQGFAFGLISSQTDPINPNLNKIEKIISITITALASAALSYLIFLNIGHPIPFTNCVSFLFQMGLVSVLTLSFTEIFGGIVQLINAIYLSLSDAIS